MAALMNERVNRIQKILEGIDIPRSYYERAVDRYKSLSDWFCREESEIAQFKPAVYVQGSFRLGLVNRPINPDEEYDLDVVCQLILRTKADVTQEELKGMVGREVKAYAKAHGIIEPATERNRCWRIDYADEVAFHIDILPCVPEDPAVVEALVAVGVDHRLAQTAIALTCKEHADFQVISNRWPMSNPAGFALWFEDRFGTVAAMRRQLLVESGVYKSIGVVPTYALKTPLQESIQILKRHRDFMFIKRPDLKPISMIITTLAAHAYQGESNLADALIGILDRMGQFVAQSRPRIPNPVNPGEDFADKWHSVAGLEENFWNWLDQARRDFDRLLSLDDSVEVRKLSESKFGVSLPEEPRRSPAIIVGAQRTAPIAVADRGPKPWGRNGVSKP